MSKTRYEWTLTDFAIWFAGAVTVPIYETSSAEQVSGSSATPARSAWCSSRPPTATPSRACGPS